MHFGGCFLQGQYEEMYVHRSISVELTDKSCERELHADEALAFAVMEMMTIS